MTGLALKKIVNNKENVLRCLRWGFLALHHAPNLVKNIAPTTNVATTPPNAYRMVMLTFSKIGSTVTADVMVAEL